VHTLLSANGLQRVHPPELAEWIKHLASTPEVVGSCFSLGDMSEVYFRESIVSGTEGLKIVCVTLHNSL